MFRNSSHTIWRLSLICYLLAIIVHTPANAADNGKIIQLNRSEPIRLKGGIEHSDTVPPMDPQYLPGKKIDLSKVKITAKEAHWIEVPKWLAGSFETHESTYTGWKVYSTGKKSTQPVKHQRHETFTYGDQVDPNGKIWHVWLLPGAGDVDTGKIIHFLITVSSNLLKSDANSFVRETAGPAIKINKKTKKIESAAYLESIMRFSPEQDGILVEGTTKVFDTVGKPIGFNSQKFHAKKIKTFATTPETAGLFKRFLKQEWKDK